MAAIGLLLLAASTSKPGGGVSMRSPWLIHTGYLSPVGGSSGLGRVVSTMAGPYSRRCDDATFPPKAWVRACMP